MGIEPTRPAWKAGILPLNYTRTYSIFGGHFSTAYISYHKQRSLSILFFNFFEIFFAPSKQQKIVLKSRKQLSRGQIRVTALSTSKTILFAEVDLNVHNDREILELFCKLFSTAVFNVVVLKSLSYVFLLLLV